MRLQAFGLWAVSGGARALSAACVGVALTGAAVPLWAAGAGPTPAVSAPAVSAPAVSERGAVTNLPLPRFVSLKGNEGNARRGPSLEHRIDWVFRHPSMPLKITAEYENWRRVEDVDGEGGWVHYTLLSGVRTVIVTADKAEMRADPAIAAPVVARAEAGAILHLVSCGPVWCDLRAGNAQGWMARSDFWGVLPDEILE